MLCTAYMTVYLNVTTGNSDMADLLLGAVGQ